MFADWIIKKFREYPWFLDAITALYIALTAGVSVALFEKVLPGKEAFFFYLFAFAGLALYYMRHKLKDYY